MGHHLPAGCRGGATVKKSIKRPAKKSAKQFAKPRWIPETLFDDLGFRMTFEVDKVLYELQTKHQHLVLFEHRFLSLIHI